MANQIALGLMFNFVGDGTTNPVVLDLTKDPYFIFSMTTVNDRGDTSSATTVLFNVNGNFDILRNLPTTLTLMDGTFVENSGAFHFSTSGDSRFSSVAISGSQITLTPTSGVTGLARALLMLEFTS